MSEKGSLEARLAQLGGGIEAAKAKLADRAGFEDDEVGDLLADINHDFDTVTHEDAARRARGL